MKEGQKPWPIWPNNVKMVFDLFALYLMKWGQSEP